MTVPDKISARTGILRYKTLSGLSVADEPALEWAIGELMQAYAKASALQRITVELPEIILARGVGSSVGELADQVGVMLPERPESFAIFRTGSHLAPALCVYGADTRALVYAVTELADRLRYGDGSALGFEDPLVESPAMRVRSISKCFQSVDEDLEWFHDRDGWDAYLTLLVTHRFNRITLTLGMQYNYPYGNEFLTDVYFYLAYPFLVEPEGHAVTITGITDEQRRRNLETLQYIGRAAARRGLEFQLALWTQSYDFTDCPRANHQIGGLGPSNIAAYCRDATAAILETVPEISGLTLRVHVECGIPEGDHSFWRTYFSAVTGLGRPIRLDLHAKGIDGTLIDLALATGMPVSVSPKYTSEHFGLPYHQASIRALETPGMAEAALGRTPGRDLTNLYTGDDAHRFAGKWKFSEGSRKFMRYSYGDLLREDRTYDILFRIWPGTLRVLLWGDPELAAGYGRNGAFCGAAGIELCEPLSFKGRMGTGISGSRTGYQPHARIHRRDWEKFSYTYRVWGRALFSPAGDRQAFRRYLGTVFGGAAETCETAIASASKILPLITLAHTATASNNSYWPEIYENMSIVHEAPRLPYGYELFSPARFGTVGACDPQLFLSPAEFALCVHEASPARRTAPLTWANWLDQHAVTAAAAMARAAGEDTALALVGADVTILAGIGRFFAAKVRAAVLWEYYLLSGEVGAARAALDCYRLARHAWASAAEAGAQVYEPDLTYGPHSWLRGRWDDRLPAIDRDIADMAAIIDSGDLTRSDGDLRAEADVARILAWSASQRHGGTHVPPAGFLPGAPIDLALTPFGAGRRNVTLHYRHADQTQGWNSVPMAWRGDTCHAAIPASYTDGPYPILYYFELESAGHSEFYPGMTEDLSSTPYFHLQRRTTEADTATRKDDAKSQQERQE